MLVDIQVLLCPPDPTLPSGRLLPFLYYPYWWHGLHQCYPGSHLVTPEIQSCRCQCWRECLPHQNGSGLLHFHTGSTCSFTIGREGPRLWQTDGRSTNRSWKLVNLHFWNSFLPPYFWPFPRSLHGKSQSQGVQIIRAAMATLAKPRCTGVQSPSNLVKPTWQKKSYTERVARLDTAPLRSHC